MKHDNRQAAIIRQHVSQIIDTALVNTPFKELAKKSDVYPAALSRMYSEIPVSLICMCKVLEALGYELIIQKKEW